MSYYSFICGFHSSFTFRITITNQFTVMCGCKKLCFVQGSQHSKYFKTVVTTTCSFHESVSLKMIPRFFELSTRSMSWSPILTLISIFTFCLRFVVIRNFDFLGLICRRGVVCKKCSVF